MIIAKKGVITNKQTVDGVMQTSLVSAHFNECQHDLKTHAFHVKWCVI